MFQFITEEQIHSCGDDSSTKQKNETFLRYNLEYHAALEIALGGYVGLWFIVRLHLEPRSRDANPPINACERKSANKRGIMLEARKYQ